MAPGLAPPTTPATTPISAPSDDPSDDGLSNGGHSAMVGPMLDAPHCNDSPVTTTWHDDPCNDNAAAMPPPTPPLARKCAGCVQQLPTARQLSMTTPPLRQPSDSGPPATASCQTATLPRRSCDNDPRATATWPGTVMTRVCGHLFGVLELTGFFLWAGPLCSTWRHHPRPRLRPQGAAPRAAGSTSLRHLANHLDRARLRRLSRPRL